MISIIVPIYKAEPCLRKCVDSILAQTYTNLEVILVDDGSPDGCPAICDEYAAKDKRIVVIHQQNAGVCAARNAGLEAAKGSYVGFVDDDDWIESDLCEVLHAAMAASGADFVASSDCTDEHRPTKVSAAAYVVYSPKEAMRKLLDNRCDLTSVWGKLFARAIVDVLRFHLDVAIAEDTLFTAEAIVRSKTVAYLDYRGYHYVSSADSVTHRFKENYWTNLKGIDLIVGLVKGLDCDLGAYAAGHVIDMDVYLAKHAVAKGALSRPAWARLAAHVRKYKSGYWRSLPFVKKCWARLLLLGRVPFVAGRRSAHVLMRFKAALLKRFANGLNRRTVSKVVESEAEMVRCGREIAAANPERYSSAWIRAMCDQYGAIFSDEERFLSILYAAIYCQSVYGTSMREYVVFDFAHRTHEERLQYVTWHSRFAYLAHLNNARDTHLLDNKFEAYERLKPFYKREAMLLTDESDYPRFCDFVARHKRIFVKPVNLELAEGTHRLVIDGRTDLHEVFLSLVKEAREVKSEKVLRPILHQLILEEEITPSEALAQFNRAEMSLLRVTTVVVNGEVHFFYPVFRVMCGDGKAQCGETYSVDALIDAGSGEVVTGGMDAISPECECHPVSGVRIKGFQMPEWESLKEMLTQAAREFPTLRYIGWDVVHTDRGWCIIEGNPGGEFFFQLCAGHGVKDEFEKLIGFKFKTPPGFRWDAILKGLGEQGQKL